MTTRLDALLARHREPISHATQQARSQGQRHPVVWILDLTDDLALSMAITIECLPGETEVRTRERLVARRDHMLAEGAVLASVLALDAPDAANLCDDIGSPTSAAALRSLTVDDAQVQVAVVVTGGSVHVRAGRSR